MGLCFIAEQSRAEGDDDDGGGLSWLSANPLCCGNVFPMEGWKNRPASH